MPGTTAHDGMTVGYALAWGVLAAGLVQLAIVWVAVRHAGISIGFRRPRLTPNVKRLLLLALAGRDHRRHHADQPADRHGDRVGPRTARYRSLAYADRIYQLPLGVVGIAVGDRASARTCRAR